MKCRSWRHVPCMDPVLSSRSFLIPFSVGVCAGIVSCGLRIYDSCSSEFIVTMWVPNEVVFNVSVVFAALVAGFRTAHALQRYTDAASYIHGLSACWYDSASTLVAFCRNSKAPKGEIMQFENTLIRLVSLLSALCLDGLQGKNSGDFGHRFEILGPEDLDDATQTLIFGTEHKVECVFQMIQQLVVDNIETKVLSIAPPILSRSFQELGAGLLKYHEAKKLACVPLPRQYTYFTFIILICEALIVPWVMAIYTRGALSSFVYTFCGVFLLWFLNFIATELDNPFRKQARTLEAEFYQHEFNQQLEQLLDLARRGKPYTCLTDHYPGIGLLRRRPSIGSTGIRRGSFGSWQRQRDIQLSSDHASYGSDTESNRSPEDSRANEGTESLFSLDLEKLQDIVSSSALQSSCVTHGTGTESNQTQENSRRNAPLGLDTEQLQVFWRSADSSASCASCSEAHLDELKPSDMVDPSCASAPPSREVRNFYAPTLLAARTPNCTCGEGSAAALPPVRKLGRARSKGMSECDAHMDSDRVAQI